MTTTATASLIEENLPKELWDDAKEYAIPEEFLTQDPELMEMILRSRSIDTKKEKQNWFNLLPIMNEDQMGKLRDILDREKKKLKEIEEKYEKKKQNIKEKYLNKWVDKWYIKKVDSIKKKEEEFEKKDEKEADELLDLI